MEQKWRGNGGKIKSFSQGEVHTWLCLVWTCWLGEERWKSWFSARVIITSSVRNNKGSGNKELKETSEILCFPGIFSDNTFNMWGHIRSLKPPLSTAQFPKQVYKHGLQTPHFWDSWNALGGKGSSRGLHSNPLEHSLTQLNPTVPAGGAHPLAVTLSGYFHKKFNSVAVV